MVLQSELAKIRAVTVKSKSLWAAGTKGHMFLPLQI